MNQLQLFLPCAAGVEGFLADEVHQITGLTGNDLLVGRGGVLLRFIDTAGMRPEADEVEKIGIERARSAAQDADAVLMVVDRSAGITEEDRRIFEALGREALVVLWGSALASGVVDNIPFTAAMAPVVDQLTADGGTTTWWALSMGACYGGNFTLIAASANLVAAGALRRSGHDIRFQDFLKIRWLSIIISPSLKVHIT